MEKIIAVHFPDIKKRLLKEAMEVFFSIRDVNGIKKKPSPRRSYWIGSSLLLAEDIDPEALRGDTLPRRSAATRALLKNEQDVHMFERLAFMSRRQDN